MWRNYEDNEVVFFKSKGINPSNTKNWVIGNYKGEYNISTYNKYDIVFYSYYNISRIDNNTYSPTNTMSWNDVRLEDYNELRTYNKYDTVLYNDSYYVSKIDNNDSSLDDTTSWYNQLTIDEWSEDETYNEFSLIKFNNDVLVSNIDSNTNNPYWITIEQVSALRWQDISYPKYSITTYGTTYFINITGYNTNVLPYSRIPGENFVAGKEGLASSLMQLLNIIKTELWYNVSYGLPLYDKVTSSLEIDVAVLKIVKSHKEVIDVKEFESKIEKHSYNCSMKVNSIYGEFLLNI